MNHEKTAIKILKCIVIIVGIFALVIRCFLENQYINFYMAIVNSVSFAVSTNILLIDLYDKFRKAYKDEVYKVNLIKSEKIKIVAMKAYLLIFICEIIMAILIVKIYFFSNLNMALCNDLLGIASLILAISYDMFNDVGVAIVMSFIK